LEDWIWEHNSWKTEYRSSSTDPWRSDLGGKLEKGEKRKIMGGEGGD